MTCLVGGDGTRDRKDYPEIEGDHDRGKNDTLNALFDHQWMIPVQSLLRMI
jgi:hypothetical protein